MQVTISPLCARGAIVQPPFSAPPFSAAGGAVRLDVRGIDHLRLRRSSAFRQRVEQVLPYAAFCPTHETVVNRGRGAVFRRAIAPPAAAFKHMNDAADDAPVILAL